MSDETKPKAKAFTKSVPKVDIGLSIFEQFETSYAGMARKMKESERKMAKQASADLATLYSLGLAMPAGGNEAWQKEVDIVKASLENIAASLGQKTVRAVRDSANMVLNKAIQFAFAAL